MTEPLSGITVAGRVVRPVTSLTVDRYNWIFGHLSACDLSNITVSGDILVAIAKAGRSAELLAGFYTAGEDWSGEDATNLVPVFAGLTDIGVLQQLNLLARVEDFFALVADSSDNSATSSTSIPTIPPSISEPSRNDLASATPLVSSASPSEPVVALI